MVLTSEWVPGSLVCQNHCYFSNLVDMEQLTFKWVKWHSIFQSAAENVMTFGSFAIIDHYWVIMVQERITISWRSLCLILFISDYFNWYIFPRVILFMSSPFFLIYGGFGVGVLGLELGIWGWFLVEGVFGPVVWGLKNGISYSFLHPTPSKST